MPLSPGDKLGPYEILAPIGAGGMGEVFRARDPRLGRDVAIKVLPAAMAHDPDRLARFQREARAVAALNHPNIVTIYSVEDAGGIHFLTMELVGGQPLDRLICADGLPVEQIVEIAGELADALAAAHEKGIVHRDLKPANVMISHEGRVKVLDFGLAKEVGGDGPDDATRTSLGNTQAGVVMGTPAYMSPEQISGRPLDYRTDIFSLGVVLHEMATGKQPFAGNSSAELISAILRDTPPSVCEIKSDLPADLARIVRRCLEKDPRHRIQTARDVSNEFRDLARQSPQKAAPQIPAQAAASSPAPTPGTPSRTVPAPDSGAARADEGFWVAVLPFKAHGANADLAALAEGLTEDIVTGMSRFSYLRVVARSATSRFTNQTVEASSAAKELGARYVMEGSVRQAGTKVRIAVQLVDATSGAHLWAETYVHAFSPEALFELQDELVPRIVSTVADSRGVLAQTMGEILRNRAADQLTPYEAVLRSFAYIHRLNAEEHAAARTALELAVAKAPGYADAWAWLAVMYREEYTQGFNPLPDPLGRCFAAAQRATEIGPSNHYAHHILASVLYFRKEFQAFRSEVERAVALNPMDGFNLAYLGNFLATSGEWERGCALNEKARSLNPNFPGWYWFAPMHKTFHEGDYRGALDFALKVNIPTLWRNHALLAAIYGQLGELEAARTAVRDLHTCLPGFAGAERRELAKFWQPDFVDQLIDGLRKAGMDIAPAPGEPTPAPTSAARHESGATRADEGFWVAVVPFKYSGTNADLTSLAEGLTEDIVTGLSRFSYLRVIARSSTSRYSQGGVDVRSVGRELGARYVMEGSLRQAGPKLRLAVQLTDATTGTHLWAETYEHVFTAESVFEVQDHLVPRIVATLADAYGVLPRTMSQALRSRASSELTPYEALLRSFAYLERVTAEEHAHAKAAIEKALQRASDSSDCWAMLSILFTDECIHGFSCEPDTLDRAVQAARRAVDLGSANHKAWQALAWAQFVRKEFRASRVAAERAISLNPMDASAAGHLGQIIAYSGDWERGCELIAHAVKLNPNHPGWFWYAPFLNAYRKSDYRGALDFACKMNMPGVPLVFVALAASHGQLGQLDPAHAALRELLALKPDYAQIARTELSKLCDPPLVGQIVEGLRKAGLVIDDGQKLAPERLPSQSGSNLTATTPSIAVLPFANLSAEKDQEYFSDGLAEEIINLLAQIAGLKVIARTSAFAFRGKEQDIRAIAEALGVTTILQGSVRRSGSRIRVTVQLINASDGAHLWSERYDRAMTDVFAVQDEIAAAIAVALQVKLSASPRKHVPKLEAYEEFLKARHHLQRWTPESAVRGRECLDRAIALDPGFALAHSDLGWCYYILAIENQIPPREAADSMRATAQKTLEIESSLPDAHAVLAMAGVLDYDWPEAGRQFQLAMASEQIQPFIRYLHSAFYLGSLGLMNEAEQGVERALKEDPLNALCRTALGSYCLASGSFAKGEAILRDVLQLDENFWIAQSWRSFSCLKQNRMTEAIAYEEKARSLAPWNPTVIGRLAGMHERVGERSRAQALLEALGDGTAFGTAGGFVCYHLVLSDIDSAADWYEKAIEQRDPRAPWLLPLQFSDLLTSSPRWPDLMRMMNLPTDAGLS